MARNETKAETTYQSVPNNKSISIQLGLYAKPSPEELAKLRLSSLISDTVNRSDASSATQLPTLPVPSGFFQASSAMIDVVFGRGAVIDVILDEDKQSAIYSASKGLFGNDSQKYVVINQRENYSVAVPIETYSGETLRFYLRLPPREIQARAIVYDVLNMPEQLPNEPHLDKQPIGVKVEIPEESLSQARINYGATNSIHHTSKIRYIGYVIQEHRDTLLEDCASEMI